MKIALITARGGSKGLPRKNILEIAGKPLIAWTIETAKESNLFDGVYVSTDDQEIADISLLFGAQIIRRPDYLAQDSSGSDSVISHAIAELESQEFSIDTICLLQPTSPLRTVSNISEGMELFNKSNDCFCVISVFFPSHSPAKSYKIESDGSIVGLLSPNSPYEPRQSLPEIVQPNGALYIFTADHFKLKNQIPREKVYPYVMSESMSEDIDTMDDFLSVERILKKRTL